jgi:YegS/Rv2252/BmrU family lipid kinase
MSSGPGQTVVIVNPKSANGALGRRWPEIAKTLTREYGAFDAVTTHAPGDATRLAHEALNGGADLVVAIGGDGTIHEVANGFFDGITPVRPQAALGILPFGTGGDFRKTTRTPKDLAEAARVLKTGTRKTIDMGVLEHASPSGPGRRMFINIASFGIAGLVDQLVNSSSKRLGGRLSFMWGTARAAVRYKNKRVKIFFDGDEDDSLEATINNVAVANGRYFGGGMKIAPDAELDDGKFDVVVLGDMTTMDFLKDGLKVYSGSHLKMPKVSHRRATRVDARPADPADEVLLDVDGETPGNLPASFTLLPRALQVVVPA